MKRLVPIVAALLVAVVLLVGVLTALKDVGPVAVFESDAAAVLTLAPDGETLIMADELVASDTVDNTIMYVVLLGGGGLGLVVLALTFGRDPILRRLHRAIPLSRQVRYPLKFPCAG